MPGGAARDLYKKCWFGVAFIPLIVYNIYIYTRKEQQHKKGSGDALHPKSGKSPRSEGHQVTLQGCEG